MKRVVKNCLLSLSTCQLPVSWILFRQASGQGTIHRQHLLLWWMTWSCAQTWKYIHIHPAVIPHGIWCHWSQNIPVPSPRGWRGEWKCPEKVQVLLVCAGDRIFSGAEPILWKSVPQEIIITMELTTFKTKCKTSSLWCCFTSITSLYTPTQTITKSSYFSFRLGKRLIILISPFKILGWHSGIIVMRIHKST